MANNQPAFTLKKREAFTFALDVKPGKVYNLPSLRSLSFEEAQRMASIDDEENLVKKGEAIRGFILRYAPELEDANLGDMEYLEIFNAYAMSEGRENLGESKASRNS